MASPWNDVRALERRLSILSSQYSGGLSVRISVRPDTDKTLWDPGRRSLVMGVRTLLTRPDLPEILRLRTIHELGKLHAGFPEPPEGLYTVPAPILTLMDDYRADAIQRDRLRLGANVFGPLYDALLPVRIPKRRLAINNLRMSVNPFILGEMVLNREMGGQARLPHERFPFLMRIFVILTRYRLYGRYLEFVSDWKAAMELGRSARSEDEFLTVAWEFHEKWKAVFSRTREGGRATEGISARSPQSPSSGSGSAGGGGSAAGGGMRSPTTPKEPGEERPPWDYRPPETTHGYGSEGTQDRRTRSGSGGVGLGAEKESLAMLKLHGEVPVFVAPSHPREVFPWDQALIRSETKSLARFLKVGREDQPLAGMTGRLISQRLVQPTLKVMNRPFPFREGGTELRILAIVAFSFSMDGWPHYYASHLTQVVSRSGVASTLDVIASSSRFQFRIRPDELNLLQPDEMEGFQNLLPLIDRTGHLYDAAIVLTDCQISDRSAEALALLRKKVLTIGCYVVPEEVEHVRGRPIEMVIEDGRDMFPSTFLYSDTFHGLGRRLALTLNRMKDRPKV